MLFEEIVSNALMEGLDVRAIKEKYYSDIPEDDFGRIVAADPTSGNGARVGSYSKWLLSLYQHMSEMERRRFVDEDLTKAKEYLTVFDKYKSQLPQNARNISKYESLPKLYDAIKQFFDNKPHTKGEMKRQIKSGAEKVYEDERWLVVIPHTEEASCLYGANTQWCTAAREDNRFDEYNEDGYLYINIDKKNNRKYQFHFERYQFVDETDDRIKSPVLSTMEATGGLVDFYKKSRDIIDFLRISSKYQFINNFKEGLAQVKLNGKLGFVDKSGREVVPCRYDDINDFSEGLASVELNDKWGFVDKSGREVVPCRYDEINDFSEGLAVVYLNDKFGIIDKRGREVVPCRYDWVSDFNEGLAPVELNGKWGYIDKRGREVVPCRYDYADDFIDGFAEVVLNGKRGFIDMTGNWHGKKPSNLQENAISITKEDLRNIVLECARRFRMSEEYMPVPKKANIPFSISPDKVLKVKKFLDGGFKKGRYEDIGADGMPCSHKVVAMLSSDGQTPLKNMYMEDLYDMLCAKFKNMFSNEQERALFMRRVADDWYDGKINSLGMLSVNHL